MLVRAIVIALLLAAPAAGADIPLSDRPLAPIWPASISAAAAPEAILVALTTLSDVYLQRLGIDGRPIDPVVTFLGTSRNPVTAVLWDGERWVVLWGPIQHQEGDPLRVTYVASSGLIEGTYELGVSSWNLPNLAPIVVGGRVFFAGCESGPLSTCAPRLFELSPPATLRPHQALPGGWLVGLEKGLGKVTTACEPKEPSRDCTISVEGPAGIASQLRVTLWHFLDFFASPEGGGLLVWRDHGLRGAIVRADGTISAPFPIGPPRELEERFYPLRGTARRGGWGLLFTVEGQAYLGEVSREGRASVAPVELQITASDLAEAILSGGGAGLLVLRSDRFRGGLSVHRIEPARVEEITAGIGEAAQLRARTALGDGVDLVVWEEASVGGLVLKATRVVPGGFPLDGAGLEIGSFGSSRWGDRFATAFDGETFVAVWIRGGEPDSIMMRTIWPDGTMSVPLALAESVSITGVEAVGAGGGRSLVAWREYHPERGARSVLLPLERGRRGSLVEIASDGMVPGYYSSAVPRLAATGDRVLAIFNFWRDCHGGLTCGPPMAYGRMFALDGVPLTGIRFLQKGLAFDVTSDGRDFFVVASDASLFTTTLLRIGADLGVTRQWQLARPLPFRAESATLLSIRRRELRIDEPSSFSPFSPRSRLWQIRQVYSLSGDLLRLEPGPERGEAPSFLNDGRTEFLSEDGVVMNVPGHPDRLVIRSTAGLPVGDLALISTGYRDEDTVTFRIEHRGGAPVRRIRVWEDSCCIRHFPMEIDERELRAGDSIEFEVTYSQSVEPAIWVAGDIADPVPANNVARYERPLRPRARTARRP